MQRVETQCQCKIVYAQEMADLRKERMKNPRKMLPQLVKNIKLLVEEDLSPQQITGKLKRENQSFVSHETIYKFIRKDKKEGGMLYEHCRHRFKHRKRPIGKHIPIKNRVSTDQRPAIVNEKTRSGDWEMDTIVGENNRGAIVTLVERKSNFMLMEKLEHGKNAKELANVVVRLLLPYIQNVHTITTDNGTEFAEHEYISKKLKTRIFFAHLYASWEKGAIENTNKLVRQYIPKKSNFDTINNQQIKQIQYKLNKRPREKLNFYSPKEIFFLNLQDNKVAFSG
ncbi:MAG: IS30 family transposase [Bacteroidales bacterium]|jgi:IS30 family transposase|nr:IS30 family transposase [Bacteroidales bacterium]